jgi:hypothetical protein
MLNMFIWLRVVTLEPSLGNNLLVDRWKVLTIWDLGKMFSIYQIKLREKIEEATQLKKGRVDKNSLVESPKSCATISVKHHISTKEMIHHR